MKSNPHYGSCSLDELIDFRKSLSQEIAFRLVEGGAQSKHRVAAPPSARTKIRSRPPAQSQVVDIPGIEAMLMQAVLHDSSVTAARAATRVGGLLAGLQALGHVESFDVYYSNFEITVEVLKDDAMHCLDYAMKTWR